MDLSDTRTAATGGTLRHNALEAVKTVKWKPEWGQERISNMIASRPDWCISRQRAWGVPITVFYCEGCNETLTDRKVLDRVVELFRKHTADAWYSTSAEELVGPGVACGKCGGTSFRKENDILDVWFDSGVSHLAVLTAANHLPWPSDLYLEGGDQYRGWFHSSLLIAVALKGAAPYRATATNGWTLDGEGHAMSKSRGSEAVEKITNKYGADLLRLWTASIDFTEDVRLSDTILERLIEAYRKLRNTLRYTLGNLSDFDPARDAVPVERMLDIDRWILSRTETLIRRCRASYSDLEFHKVYRAIYDFAATDLSSLYFDVLKDRLYTAATRSVARRSGQTALYRIHYALVRLMAPFLAFTSEEAWSFTAKPAGAPESVHLALLPETEEVASGLDAAKLADWDALVAGREPVLKALEEARQAKLIGTSLEARVRLGSTDLLERYKGDLPALFIVSQVVLDSPEGIVVEHADGLKCERCWKYSVHVGEDAEYPTVCEHCSAALKRRCSANMRELAIVIAVVALDRVTKLYIEGAFFVRRYHAGDSRLLQYRSRGEPRRGVRNARGFPNRVECGSTGMCFDCGDDFDRPDVVGAEEVPEARFWNAEHAADADCFGDGVWWRARELVGPPFSGHGHRFPTVLLRVLRVSIV